MFDGTTHLWQASNNTLIHYYLMIVTCTLRTKEQQFCLLTIQIHMMCKHVCVTRATNTRTC